MSELVVGSIAGLAANGFEVDIASGSTLDLANAKAASLPTTAIGTGSVLQVVSTTKTDTFTMSSQTYADITGLSATITPKRTSSKILVYYVVTGSGQSATTGGVLQIARGGTAIGVSDVAGSRIVGQSSVDIPSATDMGAVASGMFLDSPNTTSATTYSVQTRRMAASGTIYINRSQADADSNTTPRFSSTITLMEIAG